jgi:hypothetical protein
MQEYSVIALDICVDRKRQSARRWRSRFSLSMFQLGHLRQFISNQWSYQPLLIVLLLPATLYFIYQQTTQLEAAFGVRCLSTHQFAGVGILARQFSAHLAVLSPFMIFVAAYLLEDLFTTPTAACSSLC